MLITSVLITGFIAIFAYFKARQMELISYELALWLYGVAVFFAIVFTILANIYYIKLMNTYVFT